MKINLKSWSMLLLLNRWMQSYTQLAKICKLENCRKNWLQWSWLTFSFKFGTCDKENYWGVTLLDQEKAPDWQGSLSSICDPRTRGCGPHTFYRSSLCITSKGVKLHPTCQFFSKQHNCSPQQSNEFKCVLISTVSVLLLVFQTLAWWYETKRGECLWDCHCIFVLAKKFSHLGSL
jgi:hypothetical protein